MLLGSLKKKNRMIPPVSAAMKVTMKGRPIQKPPMSIPRPRSQPMAGEAMPIVIDSTVEMAVLRVATVCGSTRALRMALH